MLELSATALLWIKALHVISVISWMAGLLYLPRLFVYHCDAQIGTDKSETLKVMERRLLRAINLLPFQADTSQPVFALPRAASDLQVHRKRMLAFRL